MDVNPIENPLLEARAEIERLTETLQQPDQVGYWQRRCEIAEEKIERLRALLLQAYQFISPHSDPMGISNTEMASRIMRALEQQAPLSVQATECVCCGRESGHSPDCPFSHS